MNYTKEQLQGMSDFEVNKALHLKLLTRKPMEGLESINYKQGSFDVRFKSGANFLSHLKDYCNSPSNIMPLAFEHKLCIDWYTDGRCLVTQQNIKTDDIQCQSENPLRAIACCLILVLQENNNV